MANTKSAIKSIRVAKRRREHNLIVKESYKEAKKNITKALSAGSIDEAKKLLPKYQSEIDTAVKKGVLKKNTAARYKSRMVANIKKTEGK